MIHDGLKAGTTPGVTPEVTPDVTPEVAPEVTPEVTPEQQTEVPFDCRRKSCKMIWYSDPISICMKN